MEKWVKIRDYQYMISNYGNIKSIRNNKILKPYIANGYYKVDLYDNCKRKKVYVHQLLCEYFKTDEYLKSQTVNHKDGNKQNNLLDNLECVSYRENIMHAHYVLNKSNKRAIFQIDDFGNIIKKFKSLSEANRAFTKGSGIFNCCIGKNETAHGYKWSYAD